MKKIAAGFAMCGSFCTIKEATVQMKNMVEAGYEVFPIMSGIVYNTDNRFNKAADLKAEVEEICSKKIIHTVEGAEPIGPKKMLDILVVAPCTGNTLAKISAGITDTAVTMAAKAHLRSDGRLLIALASNDAMSQNLGNMATILQRKGVYFVPMRQDDPESKPHSLVAEFELIPDCIDAMLSGRQTRPLFR